MKTRLQMTIKLTSTCLAVIALATAGCVSAQTNRISVFPLRTNFLNSSDRILVGVPGVTNYGMAASSLLTAAAAVSPTQPFAANTPAGIVAAEGFAAATNAAPIAPSQITAPPWATNTPAGIVAAEGFAAATNAAPIAPSQITAPPWATNTPAGIVAAGGLTNKETGVTLTGTISGTFGTLTASNFITVNTNILLAGGASAGSYFFGAPFTNAFNGSYVSTVYSSLSLTNYTYGSYTGLMFGQGFGCNTNGVNSFASSNWFYGCPPPGGQSLSNTAYTYYQPVTNFSTSGNGSGLTNVPSTGITGGMTANIQLTDTALATVTTNTLYFTNGILMRVTSP